MQRTLRPCASRNLVHCKTCVRNIVFNIVSHRELFTCNQSVVDVVSSCHEPMKDSRGFTALV